MTATGAAGFVDLDLEPEKSRTTDCATFVNGASVFDAAPFIDNLLGGGDSGCFGSELSPGCDACALLDAGLRALAGADDDGAAELKPEELATFARLLWATSASMRIWH